MEKGWSQKTILREIVTSATYRQSSRADAGPLRARPRQSAPRPRAPLPGRGRDGARPRPRRVGRARARRSAAPASIPCQPEGIWNVPYSSLKWETSTGEDRYRRSLYTLIRRSSPYPSLMTFDAPSREQCTVRRVRTNTPLQALTTLNDPVFVEAARKLAGRMIGEGGAERRRARGRRLPAVHRPAPRSVRDDPARGASTSGKRRGSPATPRRRRPCWRRTPRPPRPPRGPP